MIMNEKVKNIINRREFLKSSLRNGFLGGIGFFSGLLVWKKNQAPDNDSSCTFKLPCQDCTKLSNCEDSKAIKIKNK